MGPSYTAADFCQPENMVLYQRQHYYSYPNTMSPASPYFLPASRHIFNCVHIGILLWWMVAINRALSVLGIEKSLIPLVHTQLNTWKQATIINHLHNIPGTMIWD